MALTVEVGLSRKVARNFASDGVSVNLRAEMDQSLLSREGEFLKQIASLYDKAQAALDRKLGVEPQDSVSQPPPAVAPRTERPSTASQMRALRSMSQRVGLDLDEIAQTETGRSCDQLSIREASTLIDLLKNRQNGHAETAGSRNGASR